MFSVGYVMGEGRAQCYAAAAASVLLARAALAASLRARAALGRLQAAGGGGGAALGQLRGLGRGCSPLRALACGAAMLGCNALLQAGGLVDRSGQDPHDKSQPTVELMGPGAAQLGWLQVARVQLPLLLLPALFYWAHSALAGTGDAGSASGGKPQRRGFAGVCRGMLPGLLGAAAVLEYGLVSAYWQVQMLDTSKQLTLKGLLAGAGGPRLGRLPPQLLGAAGAVASRVASVPLRLLLPQAVYGAAILAVVLTAVVLVASSSCTVVGRQQRFASGVLVGVVAVFSGPVVLLLGYTGPGHLLLGLVQAICFVALLQQRFAADVLSAACHELAAGGRGPGADQQQQQDGVAPPPADHPSGRADAPAQGRLARLLARLSASRRAARQEVRVAVAQGQGQHCGVGAVAWMTFGMQFFFCTQHFCEFTGLHYTSPFVGFDDMEWYRGFVMMSVNSFGGLMAAALSLPLLALAHSAQSGRLLAALPAGAGARPGAGRAGLLAGFEQAAAAFSAVRSLCMAMAMLAAGWLLRRVVV
jgi:hypothetical protein